MLLFQELKKKDGKIKNGIWRTFWIKSQTIKTDENGNFFLEQKSRIDWFHTPLDLRIVWYYADFEISKKGYKTYKTKFDVFSSYRKDNCYACEEIEFKPKIILKKDGK